RRRMVIRRQPPGKRVKRAREKVRIWSGFRLAGRRGFHFLRDAFVDQIGASIEAERGGALFGAHPAFTRSAGVGHRFLHRLGGGLRAVAGGFASRQRQAGGNQQQGGG